MLKKPLVDWGELPLLGVEAMVGLPLNDAAWAALSPDQQSALTDFFALAHPLMHREKPVTAEAWRAVSEGYDGLVALGLQEYCPVRQAAAALALDESAVAAVALASATSCWGCH